MSQYQPGCENFWNEAVRYMASSSIQLLKKKKKKEIEWEKPLLLFVDQWRSCIFRQPGQVTGI